MDFTSIKCVDLNGNNDWKLPLLGIKSILPWASNRECVWSLSFYFWMKDMQRCSCRAGRRAAVQLPASALVLLCQGPHGFPADFAECQSKPSDYLTVFWFGFFSNETLIAWAEWPGTDVLLLLVWDSTVLQTLVKRNQDLLGESMQRIPFSKCFSSYCWRLILWRYLPLLSSLK